MPTVPLLACHLTWSLPGLFLLCSRPWLLSTAAEGGLEPVPADRFRGAYPHQLSSYTLLSLSAFRARGARLPVIREVSRQHSQSLGRGLKRRGVFRQVHYYSLQHASMRHRRHS